MMVREAPSEDRLATLMRVRECSPSMTKELELTVEGRLK
jgi:hypothetical protein